MSSPLIAGIFVGGAGTRMGGVPKGLLRVHGEPLVARWRRMFGALGIRCVLVGEHPAYTGVELATVVDSEPGLGPLGGLVALLAYAGNADVVAVACDMPHVSEDLVRRLIDAPRAPAIAPRRDGRWEPFLARYAPALVLPIAQAHASRRSTSLQALLDAVGAHELALDADEALQLRDWDVPDDIDG